MTKLDDIDQKLLTLLRGNARMPMSDLSRKLNLARSTVQARLQRLEDRGVIGGYGVRFGEAFGGQMIHATILARLAANATSKVMVELHKIPEVLKASTTAGRFDLLIELSVATTERLDEIFEKLEAIDGFDDSESLVHLSRRIDRQI